MEEKFEIVVPQKDRFYPYFVTYDFESLLSEPRSKEKRENTDKLSYDRIHTPISVAIASNIEGYTEYKFIQNNDPYTLVRDFVKYLLEISKAGARKLSEKFAWVERALEEHLSETELRQGKYTVKQIEKMEKEFRRWLCEMPIIGFNSAAYDLKLCRKYIFQALLEIGENLD